MVTPFQPDLFSSPGPGWVRANDVTVQRLRAVLAEIGDASFALTSSPEQSLGLEINSNNLRLACRGGQFLLKRWSDATDIGAIERTLDLMQWLGARDLPVPAPIRFDFKSAVIHHAGSRWTLFPFFEGRWFSGRQNELEPAAIISGKLSFTLGRLAKNLCPGAGPDHLSNADSDLFAYMERERPRWGPMLGAEHAAKLAGSWPLLMAEWNRLRDDPPFAGPSQAVHFDLHPRNVLLDAGKVTAVLDFEACKVMGLGYALSFAGLKQCRQAVVAVGDASAARSFGTAFVRTVLDACPAMKGVDRFADLALAETLRRLAIIIRLNIEKGVTTWNKVLPIQLAHLSECKLLFS